MKITSFNPLIVTPKADDTIALFEALGFERKHTTESDSELTAYTSIRMNVDNFDEAYEFLKARGFVNTLGDKIAENGSSRATMMMSPSGFGISLIQHIRKEDR
ncbi:MAG: hypothetical protein K5770_15205 [Lachnospiraceae bacterium]|nr:hypothetical protein [Lachnospiraceae bacterium]